MPLETCLISKCLYALHVGLLCHLLVDLENTISFHQKLSHFCCQQNKFAFSRSPVIFGKIYFLFFIIVVLVCFADYFKLIYLYLLFNF